MPDGCVAGCLWSLQLFPGGFWIEISPDVFLKGTVGEEDICSIWNSQQQKTSSILRISHLPTSSFHLPIHFIRHINEPESVEHSINISHASDVAQSFRPIHHRSHLFYIVQCQQYRTPCQAFTILPAVDPKLFCVLPIPTFSYFIGKG